VWDRMRGRQPITTKADAFLERLKSRKAQVGETIEKEKAAKRFEATAGAAPGVADAGATGRSQEPAQTKPPPQPTPKPKEAEGYAAALTKAKKRALEDRDKEKGN